VIETPSALARTAADRTDADYGAVASFSHGDADEAVTHAEEFLAATEALLRAK
jgi:hypothetical protein